jgi:hypothetical protein
MAASGFGNLDKNAVIVLNLILAVPYDFKSSQTLIYQKAI